MDLRWSYGGRDGRSDVKVGAVEIEFERFRDSKWNFIASNRVFTVDWEKCPSCGDVAVRRVFAWDRIYRFLEVEGMTLCCGEVVLFSAESSADMNRFYLPSEFAEPPC